MKHGNLSYEFLYIPFEFYCIEFKVIFKLFVWFSRESEKNEKKRKNKKWLNFVSWLVRKKIKGKISLVVYKVGKKQKIYVYKIT